MKKWVIYIALAFAGNLIGQNSPVESYWINNGLNHSVEKSFSFENIDDLLDTNKIIKWDYFPDIIGSYNSKSNVVKLQTGVGAAVEIGYKKKLAFQLRYAVGYTNALNRSYSSDLQTKAYFTNTIGNKKYLSKDGEWISNNIYNDLRFRLTYQPIEQVEVQAGIDQIHFGEGDRSLMLGQQGMPAPFLKLKGSIWRLQYSFMHQLWSEGMFTNNYRPKGVATHYVSYKIIPNLHFGIFESVIYGMRDTLYNRGFEFEYLNPFIFFRPQEYGVGSTDNVILGADLSYQFNRHMIYGTFLVDDFYLKEMMSKKKWWANKYTIQLGVKSHFEVGEHRFFHRFEGNLIRPFTYSQLTEDVVYGSEKLPAAHPLGANFYEIYDEVNWKYKNWDVTVMMQYYSKGKDFVRENDPSGLADSTDYTGGDIYIPYTWRSEEYNYFLGRGVKYQRFMLGVHAAYGIRKNQWQVFVEPRLIIESMNKKTTTSAYFTIGIHRAIGSKRRNY